MDLKILTFYKDTKGNIWRILTYKEEKCLEFWVTKTGYGIIELAIGLKVERYKDLAYGLTQTIEFIEKVKNEEKWL